MTPSVSGRDERHARRETVQAVDEVDAVDHAHDPEARSPATAAPTTRPKTMSRSCPTKPPRNSSGLATKVMVTPSSHGDGRQQDLEEELPARPDLPAVVDVAEGAASSDPPRGPPARRDGGRRRPRRRAAGRAQPSVPDPSSEHGHDRRPPTKATTTARPPARGMGRTWTRRPASGWSMAPVAMAKRIASGVSRKDAAAAAPSARRMSGSSSSLTRPGSPGTGKRAQMARTSRDDLGQGLRVVALTQGRARGARPPGASRRGRSPASWWPATRRGCRRPCWAAAGRRGWRSC